MSEFEETVGMEESNCVGSDVECNNETTTNSDQIRSTKRPIEKGEKSKPKRAKIQKGKPEELLIKKAIQCMERSTDNAVQVKDADDVFGQYIATELKGIQDNNQKQLIKYKIQTVLFTALAPDSQYYPQSQQFMPSWQSTPLLLPFQAGNWQSRSPTPSDRSHNSYLVQGPFSPTNSVAASHASNASNMDN